MLLEHKRNMEIGVAGGVGTQFLARPLFASSDPMHHALGWLVLLVGVGCWIWGCTEYARAKGHSPKLGWLGLLSIFGLAVLLFLPDRHKVARS